MTPDDFRAIRTAAVKALRATGDLRAAEHVDAVLQVVADAGKVWTDPRHPAVRAKDAPYWELRLPLVGA